jgi:hypothetical protein
MASFRIFVISLAFGIGACSDDQNHIVQSGPGEALTVAKIYADTHFPKGTFEPNGAHLQYFVEDMGNDWKTELGPVGYLGGGLQVIIRKKDMKVISGLRTQ